MTDPQKDDHIEELLSKLQGIFGKLAHSEEEQGKPLDPVPPTPTPAPVPAPAAAAPSPAAEPFPSAAMPITVASPSPVMTERAPEIRPAPKEPAQSMLSAPYESCVPVEDPEKIIVPTALYFPNGRDADAKAVAQKLETMAPKFTKVAFRLRVIVFAAYDPKSEWKDAIVSAGPQANVRSLFILMDRPLDDAKRKTMALELEGQGVYFQEVLLTSIEKKAFYTDVLLGLVFFFDSHKSGTDAPAQTP